jgi:hypothetical protein
MSNCAMAVVLEHFKESLENEDIKSICSLAIQTADDQKEKFNTLFNQENYPLPVGFSSQEDLNSNAPKMVTDVFVLFYLHNMSKIDLALTAMCLADSVREDIRKIYSERMERAKGLYEQSIALLLQKGLFVRPPLITSTHESKPMADNGFLSNFFGLANGRPLTAREANELHKNILMNYLGKSLLMALHQANSNDELKQLLLRGKELSSKIMQDLSQVLIENDLPVAMPSDTHVLVSKFSPFSERLIAFLVDEMNKYGLANYGYGAAVSSRKDLKTIYTRIIVDVYQYQDDIKKLMIKNNWMEKPPVALDRNALSHA